MSPIIDFCPTIVSTLNPPLPPLPVAPLQLHFSFGKVDPVLVSDCY